MRFQLSREQRRERELLEYDALRLRMEVRRLKQTYDTTIQKAKRAGDVETFRRITYEQLDVMRSYEEPLKELEDRLLLIEAERHHVSPPRLGDEDCWYESTVVKRILLTDHGVSHIRSGIEEVKRARASHWIAWVGALTGLAAVLGTLLPGVIAAVKGTKH